MSFFTGIFPSKEDSQQVRVLNTSDKLTFRDSWDARALGSDFELPPGTMIRVPRGVAKHWLGSPVQEDWPDKDWGKEVDRLKLRYGTADPTHASSRDSDNWQLIKSGKLYCPEFGKDHLQRMGNVKEVARNLVQGMPISEAEHATASGATPISAVDLASFKAQIAEAMDQKSSSYDLTNDQVEELELV